MPKKLDLSGEKINNLTVLKCAGRDNKKNTVWECRCDCGYITIVRGSSIKNGHTKSCGCLQKQHAAKQQNKNKRNNHLLTFHGVTQCLKDWSKSVNINSTTIKERLNRGWSIERTLTTPTQTNNTKLCFNDILLIPRYSDLVSRTTPDISTKIGHIKLRIPIISSPMDTISGPEMLCAMSSAGGLGILTRYMNMNTIDEQARQVKEIKQAVQNNANVVGCAVGIRNNNLDHIKKLVDNGCSVICLDVAHADHQLMHQRIEEIIGIKNQYPFILMAGNVCTPCAAIGLAKRGVEAIKVGIGSGAICTTRIVSGFGIPELSAIMDVNTALKNTYPEVTIIADGGIRQSGDMVKAIWGGADICMIGYLLSGTDATPMMDGRHIYRGMSTCQASNRHDRAEEGVEIPTHNNGSTYDVVSRLVMGIKSGLAMGGAYNLNELRSHVSHVVVSPLSLEETLPRSN